MPSFPRCCLGLALFALAACGGRGPAPERTVVVYCAADQQYAEPILKEFSARTGIKVLPIYDVEATKTTGLVTRLIAEKDRPQADVFWNGEPVQTVQLKEKGILDAYRSPLAATLPADFQDTEDCWSAFGGRARVILITADSRARAPASIFDFGKNLWPPARTGVSLPLFGTTLAHAAALYEILGPQKARAWYQQLKAAGVRVYDGNSVVRDQVVNGELLFGLVDSDDAEGALRAGAKVRVIVPDQDDLGTFVFPQTVCLIRNGPHPEEARRLIDHLLSPEVEAELLAAGYVQYPCRPLPGCDTAPLIRRYRISLASLPRWLGQAQAELREIFLR